MLDRERCQGVFSAKKHTHKANVMLQIYIPKIPGMPNDFQYFPNDFGMEYEVSNLISLNSLSIQGMKDTWPLGDTCSGK